MTGRGKILAQKCIDLDTKLKHQNYHESPEREELNDRHIAASAMSLSGVPMEILSDGKVHLIRARK